MARPCQCCARPVTPPPAPGGIYLTVCAPCWDRWMADYRDAYPDAESPSRLAASHRTTCPACGQHFSGDTAFDAHRYGVPTEKPPFYGRRCRPPAEFAARGYVVTSGIWRSDQPAERPAHWHKTPASCPQGAPRSDVGDDPAITLPPAATAPQKPDFEERQ